MSNELERISTIYIYFIFDYCPKYCYLLDRVSDEILAGSFHTYEMLIIDDNGIWFCQK